MTATIAVDDFFPLALWSPESTRSESVSVIAVKQSAGIRMTAFSQLSEHILAEIQ